eukprot:jgi/Botrbrau1/17723/Bobra.0166s0145.1
MGDFNYRLDTTYEKAKEDVRRNALESLLEVDQLRAQKAAGRVFVGMREGPIAFRPTYKFDKHTPDPLAYDSSEKRRVPAWTDRIFFRGTEGEDGTSAGSEEVAVSATQYQAALDVTESDHKPVWATLVVDLLAENLPAQRAATAGLLEETFAQTAPAAPSVTVSTDQIRLDSEGGGMAWLDISNVGTTGAVFTFCRPGIAEVGLPHWLRINPISGYIPPSERVHVNFTAAIGDNAAGARPLTADLLVQINHELAEGADRSAGAPRLQDRPLHVECLPPGCFLF